MRIREAFRLELVTIAWMVIEAAAAMTAGVMAASLSLLAFGLDSLIELMSAGVLIWRLTAELRHGQARIGPRLRRMKTTGYHSERASSPPSDELVDRS